MVSISFHASSEFDRPVFGLRDQQYVLEANSQFDRVELRPVVEPVLASGV